jgi:predicted enzyme related to lactoylglutathione lyase
VDDLDAYGRKIKQAGGKLLIEKLFEDPDGRVLGMWKQQK